MPLFGHSAKWLSTIRLITLVLLGISGACGCAINTPHLAIHQWPIEQRATYTAETTPYHLSVLPLIDQRPAQERTGQRAHGLFLLVWNQRKGDYYTGDAAFGGNVAGQLSERLAAYLNASHLAAAIAKDTSSLAQLESLGAPQVKTIAAAETADVLLAGTLEHFFGSQHQDFSMWIAPLYFVNATGWQNQKTLPWGQTTATFVAYDGHAGTLVWRQQLQMSLTLPHETSSMTEAAMESFAQVATQLVAELRQLPVDTLHGTQQTSLPEQE